MYKFIIKYDDIMLSQEKSSKVFNMNKLILIGNGFDMSFG